jgi:hypothetical protein
MPVFATKALCSLILWQVFGGGGCSCCLYPFAGFGVFYITSLYIWLRSKLLERYIEKSVPSWLCPLCGGIASLIINFGTTLTWMIGVTARPRSFRGKDLRWWLDKRLCEPQSCWREDMSARAGNTCTCPDIILYWFRQQTQGISHSKLAASSWVSVRLCNFCSMCIYSPP